MTAHDLAFAKIIRWLQAHAGKVQVPGPDCGELSVVRRLITRRLRLVVFAQQTDLVGIEPAHRVRDT